METRTLARINKVQIQVVEDESIKVIPIKPICEAIGVDFSSQKQRIERDEILSSTVVMTTIVAADGKEREMFCLPLKYSFGWLFSIDTSRVNEDAREAVVKYKHECYNALYEHFAEYAEYVEIRGKAVDRQLEIYEDLRKNFNEARFNMEDAKKKLYEAKAYNFEKYKQDKHQFKIDFLQEAK